MSLFIILAFSEARSKEILIAYAQSWGPSMGCPAKIRTQGRLTAAQRTSHWAAASYQHHDKFINGVNDNGNQWNPG
jgi:hypothetical protein